MKKIAIVVAVSVLAVLIIPPVMRSVNLSAGKPVSIDRALTADGWPLPPPILKVAPSKAADALVADGWPLPPPILKAAPSKGAGALVLA